MIGIDTNFLLVNSMYFMHCVIWSLGDYYYYKFVKLMAGPRCAILTTMISLTNESVNRYVSRTSANGVEGNLAIIALYYYQLIQPKIFNKQLAIMTFVITISFIIRSSSLAAWVPLAVLKIIQEPEFLIPIVVAGLSVTIPSIILSICLDSIYYGTFTIP